MRRQARPHRPSGRLDRLALLRASGQRRQQRAEDRLRPGRRPLAGLDRGLRLRRGAASASGRARRRGRPDHARKPRKAFGLSPDVRIIAGTTDGCASFLATGASAPGDGVTALGTTLTLKLLSDKPIFAPEYGIYSHRILGQWLAGGASNTGGGALLAHFTADEMDALTPRLDPGKPTGLDYYPLTRPGERFPIADPNFAPRVEPKPADRAVFLQGLLEGVAEVEALGYRRLAELGAPPLRSVRSVGGGAKNPAWTKIRAAKLKVPMLEAVADEAAYGAAILARAAR